jgi:HK97 family phage portal protein
MKLSKVLALGAASKSSLYDEYKGQSIALTDGNFWGKFMSGPSWSGEAVSIDRTLQLSTAWACIGLLSETIATLPLGFFEKKADGTRTTAGDHALYRLLHDQPNADMTAVVFWQVMMTSLLLRGAAFAEKVMRAGVVSSINYLNPDRLTCKHLSSGAYEYTYREKDGETRPIPESRILKILGFSLDGKSPLSPIAYARNVFGSAMATDRAAARVFSKGLRASGFLKSKNTLKPLQREQLRESLNKFSGSEAAGGMMVLEAELDYQGLSMNPDDAQMLETRGFGVEEICRWFRVPPFMVGHNEKSTSWGSGIEQQMLGFLTFSLRPWLTRIEQAIKKDLLTPAERLRYFAEFSVEGLLRADSAGRAAYLAQMTQNGLMSRNEGRAYDNRPPVEGGDALTVQSNLLPIHLLGQQKDAQTAQDAVKAWLGINDSQEPKA